MKVGYNIFVILQTLNLGAIAGFHFSNNHSTCLQTQRNVF
jgi:hypothetical protein